MPDSDSQREPQLIPAERRAVSRKRVFLKGTIAAPDGAFSVDCCIRNISPAGAKVTLPGNATLPKHVYFTNLHDRATYEAIIIETRLGVSELRFEYTHPFQSPMDIHLKFLKRL
jgi:hypothetical protein